MDLKLKKCQGLDVGGFHVADDFYDMRLYIDKNDQMLLFKMGHEGALLEVSWDSFLTLYKDGKPKLQIGKFSMYGDCLWNFKFFESGELIELGVKDIYKAEEAICKLLVERGLIG